VVPPICTVAKQRVRKLCFEMSGTQGVHSNIRSWSLAGVPWVKIAVTQLTDRPTDANVGYRAGNLNFCRPAFAAYA